MLTVTAGHQYTSLHERKLVACKSAAILVAGMIQSARCWHSRLPMYDAFNQAFLDADLESSPGNASFDIVAKALCNMVNVVGRTLADFLC